MMRRLVCSLFVPLVLIDSANLSAEQFAAARLLPESVVIYAETPSAGVLLDDLLDRPQRQKLEALPRYQQWLESEERKQLMMGVRFVEAQLGLPWRRGIEKLGDGGIYFALDGASRSVAVLVESDDEAFLKKSHDTLLNLARVDAAGKGNPDPFESIDYRGVKAYRADKIRFAIVGQWLVLTNSDGLGKRIIENILDGPERSLAQNDRFRTAYASRHPTPLAWAYADLATIRSAGVAKPLLGGKSADPGAELLFGGLLNTLHNAPFATAQLTSEKSSIELSVTLPHDPSWTPKEREFFFGPQHQGAAPAELALPETILEVRAYRGVSGMWLHGPDLFNEEINAGLAKANSDLSTLFGGRPFAEEILGALDGGLRFLAVREPSSARKSLPNALQLPGFAAVARLKDPATAQRPLRIAFQTAVGFANLTGAQQGRPPLELETERRDGKTLLTAYYSPDDFEADADKMEMAAGAASLLLSLSPTVGFTGDSVVLASTRALADQLLERLAADAPDVRKSDLASSPANSALRLQAGPLRAMLAENRERLISNNMLEKGHDRAAAIREVDGLLTLLEFLDQGYASLRVQDAQLQFLVRLTPVED